MFTWHVDRELTDEQPILAIEIYNLQDAGPLLKLVENTHKTSVYFQKA